MPVPPTASTAPAEERVREAALDLFAARGYHGTGIRQLAEHAGLSSASLYHYMGTKEDLLVAIMRTCLDRLIADAEAVVTASADPEERLAELIRMHVRAHAERPRETRVVDGEVEVLGAAARAEVITLRDRYESIWQSVVEDVLTAIGASAGEDARLARRALLEMCSGVARWYRPDGRSPLEDVADRYAVLGLRLVGVPHPSHPSH